MIWSSEGNCGNEYQTFSLDCEGIEGGGSGGWSSPPPPPNGSGWLPPNDGGGGIGGNENPVWRKYRKLVLFSELFHAYQKRFYDGKEGRPKWEDVPLLNRECEQRFFIEYIEYLSQQAGNSIFGFKQTECFITDIIERNRLREVMKMVKQREFGIVF